MSTGAIEQPSTSVEADLASKTTERRTIGPKYKPQVACRTSNIHKNALTLLQAADASLKSALDSFPYVIEVNDLVTAAKSDIKEAFSMLPSLQLAHPDLQASCRGSAALCPNALCAHDTPETTEANAVKRDISLLLQLVNSAVAWVECNKAAYDKTCQTEA